VGGEGKQRKIDLACKIQDLDSISGATDGEGGIRSRRWYIWEKGN
jgi:hypothetical protein